MSDLVHYNAARMQLAAACNIDEVKHVLASGRATVGEAIAANK